MEEMSPHGRTETATASSVRPPRADEVEARTGMTVSYLPLKKRFYLVETGGRWELFLSSLYPEQHAEILQTLIEVGPMAAAGATPAHCDEVVVAACA